MGSFLKNQDLIDRTKRRSFFYLFSKFSIMIFNAISLYLKQGLSEIVTILQSPFLIRDRIHPVTIPLPSHDRPVT